MNQRIWVVLAILLGAVSVSIGLYWQVDTIHRGGIVMVPIVMCSIFSMTIAIERAYYFMSLRLGADTAQRLEGLRAAVEGHQWAEAQQLAEQWHSPVARVALTGLALKDHPARDIDEAMEEAAHQELPAVERSLRWLSTLAQVSTLMGLLGTVTGLVSAFQVIQAKSTGGNPVSPGDLAGGVWEALITTVGGLAVAIPTILAYNYFVTRVDEVQFQMEKVSALIAGWRRLKGTAHTT